MREKIIEIIVREFELDTATASEFYDNIFASIVRAFAKNKNINIPGFGKFTLVTRNGNKEVKFSPSKKIAEEINKDYSDLVPVSLNEIISKFESVHISEEANGGEKASQSTEEAENEAKSIEEMDDNEFEKFILQSDPELPEETAAHKESMDEIDLLLKEKTPDILHKEETHEEKEAEDIDDYNVFKGFEVDEDFSSAEESVGENSDELQIPESLKTLHEEIESFEGSEENNPDPLQVNDFNEMFFPAEEDRNQFQANDSVERDIYSISSFDDVFMPIKETGKQSLKKKESAAPVIYKPAVKNKQRLEDLAELNNEINDLSISEITEEDQLNLTDSQMDHDDSETPASDETIEELNLAIESDFKKFSEDPGTRDLLDVSEEIHLLPENENNSESGFAQDGEEKDFSGTISDSQQNPDESLQTEEEEKMSSEEQKDLKDSSEKDELDKEIERIENLNKKEKIEGAFDPFKEADDYEKNIEAAEDAANEKADDDLDDILLKELNSKIDTLEGEIKSKIEKTEEDLSRLSDNKSEETKAESKKTAVLAEKKKEDMPADPKPEQRKKPKPIQKPAAKKDYRTIYKNSGEETNGGSDKKVYRSLIIFLIVICGLILVYGIFSTSMFRNSPPAGLSSETPVVQEQAPPVTTPPPVLNEQTNNSQNPPVTENKTEPPNTTPNQQTPPKEQAPPVQNTPAPVQNQIIENGIIYNQTSSGFTIQAASFKDRANATSKLNEYKQKGLNGFVEEADLGDNGKYYRVKIGYYKTLDEAKKDAGKIK